MSGSSDSAAAGSTSSTCEANVLIAFAERDNVVPPAAVEPIMRLIGDPAKREELRLPGGHVTFGTGRSAMKRDHAQDGGLDHGPQRRADDLGSR